MNRVMATQLSRSRRRAAAADAPLRGPEEDGGRRDRAARWLQLHVETWD